MPANPSKQLMDLLLTIRRRIKNEQGEALSLIDPSLLDQLKRLKPTVSQETSILIDNLFQQLNESLEPEPLESKPHRIYRGQVVAA
ncbi:hypothetical protein EOPP23_17010 [Endozoicomonas sp. OPT23]|uniref:hypothetical protein n=1 Tax=Endozoicomonas sp. OPT23 TaxID=2072845 RepID=UPI00129AA730|nr:hypothetical protein [Endozoicomonas sp. OPT23]MRI34685.1 hypothetical protein [Endozoicomonas sp. OPT23]